MQNIEKVNKMSVTPIPKLLIGISFPIMVSMLLQALYNIVDSVFVSYISEDAFTAVSLVFPIQMLIVSVGVGTGVGINSLLSRKLGENNKTQASKVAVNGIFVSLLSGIAFAVLAILFAKNFIGIYDRTQQINEWAIGYLIIVNVFSFSSLLQFANERIVQSTGNSVYVMIIQGAGAVINIILDPIFIFVLGFGVYGAAIATVIGQTTAMLIGFVINAKLNKDINMSFKGFKPDKRIILEIYRVGFPAIIMQSIISLMTIILNKILLPYSDSVAAVIGAYTKLNSFVFMPVFGITNAMVPIVAYNYGAQKKDRVIKTFFAAQLFTFIIMILGTALFFFWPQQLLSLFETTPQMSEIAIPALQIISLSFVLFGICVVCSSFFQALGNGVYSLVVSIIRQLIIILPASYLLAKMFGLNAAWWAFVLSEAVSVVACVFFLKSIYTKVISKMKTN